MAKFSVVSPLSLSLFIVLAIALVGCQQQTAKVESLSPPSFDPPAVAQAPVAQKNPAPQPPPAPRQFQPAAPAIAGIPREWVPAIKTNTWRWIVVHHSATPSGGAVAFDKMHRAKGWDELGYHFVIGNGTDTRDGQVEVGSRWPKQKWGAHAKTPDNQYNNFGIGICLVGNFDVDRPTAAQLKSLAKLVAYLEKTYHISPDHVIGHKDTGKSTDCPGFHTSLVEIRRMASQILAESDPVPMDEVRMASSKELLEDKK